MNIYFVKTQILKIIQKNAFENPIKISKKNQKIFAWIYCYLFRSASKVKSDSFNQETDPVSGEGSWARSTTILTKSYVLEGKTFSKS